MRPKPLRRIGSGTGAIEQGIVPKRVKEIDEAEKRANSTEMGPLDGSPTGSSKHTKTFDSNSQAGSQGHPRSEKKQTKQAKARRKVEKKEVKKAKKARVQPPPPPPPEPLPPASPPPPPPPPRSEQNGDVVSIPSPAPEPQTPATPGRVESERQSRSSPSVTGSSGASEKSHESGSGGFWTPRYCAAVVVVVVIIVLALTLPMLIVDEEDDSAAPPPFTPSPAAPSSPAVVLVELWSPDNTPATSFTMDHLRRGVAITLTVSNGNFSGVTRVLSNSNVSVEAEPNGFLAKGASSLRITARSPSQLRLAIGPVPALRGYTREMVSVTLDGGPSYRGIPFYFIVTPDTPELPRTSLREQTSKVTAAAATISAGAAVGTAAAVGHLPRLNLLAAAFECPSEDFGELGWTHHPLSLLGFPPISLGDDRLANHISAVIGCIVVLAVASVILLCAVAVAITMWFPRFLADRHNRWGPAAMVGFPNYIFAIYAFLLTGLASGSFTTLFYHNNTAVRVAAFLVQFLLIEVFLVWASTVLFFHFPCEYVAMDMSVYKRGPIHRFLLGRHEWEGAEDPTFLPRFRMLFEDYVPRARWFLVFEVVVTTTMAITESFHPADLAQCRWRSWILLFINSIHLGVLTFVCPFIAPVEMVYGWLASALNQVILVMIVVNHHKEDREHWSADVAGVISTASVYLIKVKIFLDIVIFIIELLEERRIEQEEEEREGPPVTEGSTSALERELLPLDVPPPDKTAITVVLDEASWAYMSPRGRGRSSRYQDSRGSFDSRSTMDWGNEPRSTGVKGMVFKALPPTSPTQPPDEVPKPESPRERFSRSYPAATVSILDFSPVIYDEHA